MSDLGSVDRRIEWANQHIEDLQQRFDFFRQSKAYEIVTKPDEIPGRMALALKINEPAATAMFTEIALRVGDIAHNLRSALDHLAFRTVANPARIEDIAFPVWRKSDSPTPAQYKAVVLSKVKGATPAVVGRFLALEPYYKGKDEPLRTLDELNIVDKHRLSIGVFGSNEAVALNFGALALAPDGQGNDMPDLWLAIRPAERYPLKDGDILFGGLDEKGFQLDPQPHIEVVLTEPQPVAGEPLIPTLTKLSKYVSALVDTFRPLM